jgi:hypothetical protein
MRRADRAGRTRADGLGPELPPVSGRAGHELAQRQRAVNQTSLSMVRQVHAILGIRAPNAGGRKSDGGGGPAQESKASRPPGVGVSGRPAGPERRVQTCPRVRSVTGADGPRAGHRLSRRPRHPRLSGQAAFPPAAMQGGPERQRRPPDRRDRILKRLTLADLSGSFGHGGRRTACRPCPTGWAPEPIPRRGGFQPAFIQTRAGETTAAKSTRSHPEAIDLGGFLGFVRSQARKIRPPPSAFDGSDTLGSPNSIDWRSNG